MVGAASGVQLYEKSHCFLCFFQVPIVKEEIFQEFKCFDLFFSVFCFPGDENKFHDLVLGQFCSFVSVGPVPAFCNGAGGLLVPCEDVFFALLDDVVKLLFHFSLSFADLALR